jgi:hypothetical protein
VHIFKKRLRAIALLNVMPSSSFVRRPARAGRLRVRSTSLSVHPGILGLGKCRGWRPRRARHDGTAR